MAHPAEELEAHAVVSPPVHRVNGEEPVLRLDEEAAQALHDAGGHEHVRASEVELGLVLRRAQQRRSQEEIVSAAYNSVPFTANGMPKRNLQTDNAPLLENVIIQALPSPRAHRQQMQQADGR